MAGKKPAPAKFEEFADEGDEDSWDDSVADSDGSDAEQNLRLRDWRDVEKYREMKELRQLVDGEFDAGEIFDIPVRPKAVQGLERSARNAARQAERTPVKPAKKAAPEPAKKAPARRAAAKPKRR